MDRAIRVRSGLSDADRDDLVSRLRARQLELTDRLSAHIRDTVNDPLATSDEDYMAGSRVAVEGCLKVALTEMEPGRRTVAPVPRAMIAQARRAVHSGVALDSVLRRFVAGERLFVELVADEVDQMPSHVLRELLRNEGPLLERVMAAISLEYEREREKARPFAEQRLLECVQRLLDGVYVDSSELDYELDAWHIGLVASGLQANDAIRAIASRLDRQVLVVPRHEGTVSAWLGGERRITVAEIERACSVKELRGVSLGVGDVERGLDGWRLTHHQAHAALRVALHTPQRLARYKDCALLAAALADETLTKSLRATYISPLDGESDSGMVLIGTLRAYLEVGCNAATAAHRLDVDRKTVERRIHKIETRLDRPLRACHAELEVALRLEALDRVSPGE